MSNLNRFIEAQEKIYDIALSEIKRGNKIGYSGDTDHPFGCASISVIQIN